MRHVSSPFLPAALASLLWLQLSTAQSNTTCASTQLDWYTDVVGETPCVTYQRLRQICNNDYKVQKFRSLTPGDNCNDQVSSCCCNSISWALSMLCMNCQYDAADDTGGIDAGTGAYQLYLENCSKSPQNQTLPNDIQNAVCNKEIKIDRNLYNLFWGDGQWFYTYTKETMQKDFAASNNNTFTKCASTTNNGTTSSSSMSSTQTSSSASTQTAGPSSSSSSSSSTGPVVGGVVGAIAALAVAGAAFFLWWRKRRNRGPRPLDLTAEYEDRPYADGGDAPMGMVTPFTATVASNSRYGAPSPSDDSSPESYALLPRRSPGPLSGTGPVSEVGTHHTGATSRYNDPYSPSSHPGSPMDDELERHEDGGPVPSLQRSASGRLPPAYRSWEESDSGPSGAAEAASEIGTSNGSSSGAAGTSESGAASLRPLRPRYLGDVKSPQGPS